MAGFGNLDVTNIQHGVALQGGSCLEYGDWSTTGNSATQAVTTRFSTLICGLAIGEGAYGRAVSICEGPTIDFTMSAALDKIQYIAFGW